MNSALYVWRDDPSQHAFWKACGISTLQFCDTHWAKHENRLDQHYADFAAEVSSARRAGFRVGMILFSNIAQWRGPGAEEPTGMGVLFDPRDPDARRDRLKSLARAIRALGHCDFFTLLAGDPGGAIGAKFGPRTVDDFLDFAGDVRALVKRNAPRADFHVNPWAIAYWQHPTTSCETPDWWVNETALSRQMLLAPGRRWDSTIVEIPGHTGYRPMALRCLRKARIAPPDFPTRTDTEALRRAGAQQVWAWPYFLLDEADDGDLGPAGRAVQIETRYIHRHVQHLRRTGVDMVVGNWTYAGHKPRQLNTFAFGTMILDPAATPESVIDRFAAVVASTPSGATTLGQVLRWIENDSNWHRKLPEADRLAPLPCKLRTLDDARAALKTVQPHPNPTMALAEAPGPYLERLRRRLLPGDRQEIGR